MKIVLFILMFLMIGALLILNTHNLPLYKEENILQFKGLYVEWLNGIYKNSQTITGDVIDMNWLPEE